MEKENISNIDWSEKSILIVEDEEINYLFIETLLSMTRAKITHAWNGKQAVDRVKEGASNIDLILMDLKMPKMDGYETTRFIRQSEIEELRNIPIIALTANVAPLEKEVCLGIGMNDYIAKPFNEKELIKKMNILLNKKAN